MKIFGINTATNKTAAALAEILPLKKSRVIYSKTWDSNRDEAEKLIPAISEALKKGRPDLILVIKGPGAFTGLRIGVTVANTLAFALNIPVSGITTYDFLRAHIPESLKEKTALLLKAGGRFAAVLLPKDKKPHRLAAEELEEFFIRNPQVKFVVGDMNTLERKKILLPEKISWLPGRSLIKMPKVFAQLSAGKSPHKKPINLRIVAPQYLLPPKITQSKKPVFAGAMPH